ncbi:hypothetical protein KC331_g30 [Hortaea werneckii]|nr:hypothetical protein KC331_g30 [Hortaea werneckii]
MDDDDYVKILLSPLAARKPSRSSFASSRIILRHFKASDVGLCIVAYNKIAPATTPTTPAAEPANANPVGFAPESDVSALSLSLSEVDSALSASLVADAALTWTSRGDNAAARRGSLAAAPRRPGSRGAPWARGPTYIIVNNHTQWLHEGGVLKLTRPGATRASRSTPPGPHPSWSPRPNGPYPLPAAQPGAPPAGPPCPPPFGPQPHGAPVVMVFQELATELSAEGKGLAETGVARPGREVGLQAGDVGGGAVGGGPGGPGVAVAALPVAGGTALRDGGGKAGEEGGGGCEGGLHCGCGNVDVGLLENPNDIPHTLNGRQPPPKHPSWLRRLCIGQTSNCLIRCSQPTNIHTRMIRSPPTNNLCTHARRATRSPWALNPALHPRIPLSGLRRIYPSPGAEPSDLNPGSSMTSLEARTLGSSYCLRDRQFGI